MKLSACSILIGAVVADYPSYTIPNEPDIIDWGSPFDRQAFRQNELGKDFVRFQMPDDEYVPIEELPIVYLNGIKFHRQGKQPRAHDLDRFKKITRSKDGHLQCQGNSKAKLHLQHNQEAHSGAAMANDFIGINPRGLDLTAAIFQTKYPRYNGKDLPLPFNELASGSSDLTHLEPLNEWELHLVNQISSQSSEGVRDEEEWEFDEVNFPSEQYINPVVIDEGNEPLTDAEYEKLRLKALKSKFKNQMNVKIGCCNGLPYNSSKRCCCRRIPFDKDRKFCCAINGCESFQIFDRSNKQHYKDCLSLSGLVIQEYGYRGQSGQPEMQRKTTRARPGN